MKFSLLINLKMPTVVGIFIFISRENFILSFEHEKRFITSGPGQNASKTVYALSSGGLDGSSVSVHSYLSEISNQILFLDVFSSTDLLNYSYILKVSLIYPDFHCVFLHIVKTCVYQRKVLTRTCSLRKHAY